jgi:hypothetical protein
MTLMTLRQIIDATRAHIYVPNAGMRHKRHFPPVRPRSPARGCTAVHDDGGAAPMRSQRERANHAAPRRQNAPEVAP